MLLEPAGQLEQGAQVLGAGQQWQLHHGPAQGLDVVAQLVLGGPPPGVLDRLGGQRIGECRAAGQVCRGQPGPGRRR